MKVVKVSIEMNGFLQFSGFFTHYPTLEELFPHIPVAHRGSPDPQALLQVIDPKLWVIVYDPYKIIQYVSSFGVLVGKIEMEELEVSDCVGFDPKKTVHVIGPFNTTKTVQPTAEAAV
jgi:hypothetical protein